VQCGFINRTGRSFILVFAEENKVGLVSFIQRHPNEFLRPFRPRRVLERTSEQMKVHDDIHLDGHRTAVFLCRIKAPCAHRLKRFFIGPQAPSPA
jgi:hypothetical protein